MTLKEAVFICVAVAFPTHCLAHDESSNPVGCDVVGKEIKDIQEFGDKLPDSFYYIYIFDGWIPVPTRVSQLVRDGQWRGMSSFNMPKSRSYRGCDILDGKVNVEIGEISKCSLCGAGHDLIDNQLRFSDEWNHGSIQVREYKDIYTEEAGALVAFNSEEYMMISSSFSRWEKLWRMLIKWHSEFGRFE